MRKLPLNLENIIYTLDSYKQLHPPMYPEGTEYVESYAEARANSEYDYTIMYGLQYNMIRWMEGVVITKEMLDEAEPLLKAHFKFCGDVWTRERWEYIINVHGGKLPLRICAVPEGLKIPKSNILYCIRNTDKNCWWLTNALETLLQQVWYPIAVATRSHEIVNYISKAFDKTVDADSAWLLNYMLHDFGQRACTCMEQAGIGGSAHLVNSNGTDTVMSLPYAVNFYKAVPDTLAHSVPADEHSIATAEGEEGEYGIAQRLCKIFPTGILSKVSDSFGITKAVKEYCSGKTRDFILARDGKFVVRPDSKRFAGDTPCDQVLWIVQQLDAGFGTTLNSKGFKVLSPKVGVIYGDGLSQEEIFECVDVLVANGYAASTCVYGQGGGLLQKLNRDTLAFAIKCCAQTRNGVQYDIYKKPEGATKVSKKGQLKLVRELDTYVTVPISDPRPDVLVPVFENGVILREYTFDEVRANALL